MHSIPSPRQAGRGTGRGVLIFTRNLTPTLSPIPLAESGENFKVAHIGVQSVFIRVHLWLKLFGVSDGFGQLRLGDGQRRGEADDVAVLAFGQKNVSRDATFL